ncbi:TPA: hypothetical protein ACF7WO_002386 [Klebsiella pneumoniae]
MTDITELAQSLKAEGISPERMEWLKKLADMKYCANNPGHWLMNLKETNYLASLALQCLESNSTMVEALEKAQAGEKQWREVVDAFCSDDADWHKLTNSNNELIALLSQTLCKQADRIAELESRTVTVKLPKPHAHLIWIQAGHAPDDYWDDVAVSHSEKDRCCDGSERYPVYARWEIEGMLTAAGIKVEAE